MLSSKISFLLCQIEAAGVFVEEAHLDTEYKLNVHKIFRRRPERLLEVFQINFIEAIFFKKEILLVAFSLHGFC